MADEMTVKDGFLFGPWRTGVNAAASMTTSIHDNAVGKSVGMRGGVVAGTVHLDLFAPLAVKAFGPKWFESGSVSMFYTFAILGGEELRAVVQLPPPDTKDSQVAARAETPDGKTVMEGTISLGNPREKSHLRAMELKNSPQESLRILKGVKSGDALQPRQPVAMMSAEEIETARAGSEEWLDWYEDKSPWSGAIIPPGRLAWLMHVYPAFPLKAVAFYGATEIRFMHGPAIVGEPYTVSGKAVCVGTGGRTEFYWTDSELRKKDGTLVATMLHLHRLMKKGSPLYPEEK
jgi:hypothetical protein